MWLLLPSFLSDTPIPTLPQSLQEMLPTPWPSMLLVTRREQTKHFPAQLFFFLKDGVIDGRSFGANVAAPGKEYHGVVVCCVSNVPFGLFFVVRPYFVRFTKKKKKKKECMVVVMEEVKREESSKEKIYIYMCLHDGHVFSCLFF